MRKLLTGSLIAISTLIGANQANSAAILFAQVDNTGPYNLDGNQIAQFLTDAGHTVTNRILSTATYNDYSSFDQIWVYDLFGGLNNNSNQMDAYSKISAWFNNRTQKNLITDGRIISSGPRWTAGGEPAWIQNYATQLQARGGGLVLGTDHANQNACSGAFVDGINNINTQINIDPFCDFYATPPLEAVVDPASPLYLSSLNDCSFDTTKKCINDNSSTSFAPAGVQAAGFTLTPVAYHGSTSTAFTNAAVSATFGSITFGTCGGPNQPPCGVEEPASTVLAGIGFAAFFLAIATRRRNTH